MASYQRRVEFEGGGYGTFQEAGADQGEPGALFTNPPTGSPSSQSTRTSGVVLGARLS
jgi:hypothetical protein